MDKYVPSEATLDFMVWCKSYLPPLSNKSSIEHYKLIDYYNSAEADDIQMAEIHRGWGKSQWNMMYAIYLVSTGVEPYALIVGATQDLTNDLVASAGAMLEESDIPGVTVERNVEGIVELKRADGSMGYIVAKSTGSKLRGIAKGSKRDRPSVIVLDDIVSDDLVLNRLRMLRANSWMTSALLPALSPGGRIIGSGTPMHQSDPFMTLVEAFGSHKIPLSLTSFPDRFTPDFIERKKSQYKKLGQMRDWKREMELVLTDSDTQLFDMKMVKRAIEMPSDVVCFMTCDLAFSEKDSADESAIIINGVDSEGRWYIYSVSGRWKPSETASKIFELVARFDILDCGIETGASFIAVEEHLRKQMLEYQTYFNIIELKHGGKSKISRISTLQPVVDSGRLHIIDNGEKAEQLMEQLELCDSFGCSAVHDDLVDALAYQTFMNLGMAVDTTNHIQDEEYYYE